MEPSIRFVCRNCGKDYLESLNDLAPGKLRSCIDCGDDLRLTEETQMELRHSLEWLFPTA